MKPVETLCDNLVDNDLPKIIAAVENKESPSKVCDQLKLCTNGTLVAAAAPVKSTAAVLVVPFVPAVAVASAVAAPQDGMCTVCQAIVGFVESYLEQNSTEAQIQARLDAACALTGPFATECKALVDQYLPQIIAWVEKNETPQDICTKLGVCNSVVAATKEGLQAFAKALTLAASGNPELWYGCFRLR